MGWARRNKVLALVSIGTYLTALDVTIVNIAFRAVQRSFGSVPPTLLTWIISGYNIAFAAGLLTAGRMAESFGRRRAFLVGIGVFSISSMACGLAPSVPFLIAGRVVQALGAALIVPSGIALLLPEFAVERRAWAMGIVGAVGGIGAATGPAVGGVLVDSLGWRWVFFVNVPFCGAAILAGRRLLRERRDETARQLPDFLGAALALAAVALLTLATVESHRWGWHSAREIVVVGVAVLLGAAFVRRTRTQAVPVLDLALLRLRFVSAANIAGVLYAMGFYALNFVSTQWMQEVWHWREAKAGVAMLPGPLMSVAVAVLAGRWVQRFGHNALAVPGALVMGAACLGLAVFTTTAPDYWRVYFPAQVAIGVGIGLSIAVLSSAANAYLPPHRFAMGSALYTTGRQVGAALGIAVVTALRAAAPSIVVGDHWSWIYIAGTMAATAVTMAVLFRRPSESELAASVVA